MLSSHRWCACYAGRWPSRMFVYHLSGLCTQKDFASTYLGSWCLSEIKVPQTKIHRPTQHLFSPPAKSIEKSPHSVTQFTSHWGHCAFSYLAPNYHRLHIRWDHSNSCFYSSIIFSLQNRRKYFSNDYIICLNEMTRNLDNIKLFQICTLITMTCY